MADLERPIYGVVATVDSDGGPAELTTTEATNAALDRLFGPERGREVTEHRLNTGRAEVRVITVVVDFTAAELAQLQRDGYILVEVDELTFEAEWPS
jgi:hypothetical protein